MGTFERKGRGMEQRFAQNRGVSLALVALIMGGAVAENTVAAVPARGDEPAERIIEVRFVSRIDGSCKVGKDLNRDRVLDAIGAERNGEFIIEYVSTQSRPPAYTSDWNVNPRDEDSPWFDFVTLEEIQIDFDGTLNPIQAYGVQELLNAQAVTECSPEEQADINQRYPQIDMEALQKAMPLDFDSLFDPPNN